MLILVLIAASFLSSAANSEDPINTGGPRIVYEGRDALLSCMLSESSANNTVIWKKGDEILTAGKVRVTSDQRIRILHDGHPAGNVTQPGEVWVLLIENPKLSDTGSYTCELNTDPVLRSIHTLTVRSRSKPNNSSVAAAATEGSDLFLVPPLLDSNNSHSFWRPSVPPQISHDFSVCCEHANVSSVCMGFCNIHNILDGTTGIEPEACERDFPSIVRCMADGRNHVPCCVEKQVPDLCQDMCRGEYSPFTDLLRTRVSCVQHTLSGLQCILQGVQMIPSMPVDVIAEGVTETTVTVSWSSPEKLSNKVQFYKVNLTALHTFDEDEDGDTSSAVAASEKVNVFTVPSNQTTLTLSQLNPLTMYSILVTAVNEYGSSLPSERVRIFTHTTETSFEATDVDTSTLPELPDVRSCCAAKGMTHRFCLEKMCDPQKTDLALLPDYVVCAPWANITFHCLANNIDHTPCCRARGIPSMCFHLCSGKVKLLTMNTLRCLRFMPEYNSCLFQGYGVLAGPPSKLRTLAKSDNFIILDWSKSKKLADSVSSYHVKFRRLGVGDDYFTVEKKNPPLILEGLEPNVFYEFFVVAVNAYGKSEPSPRLITRTKLIEEEELSEPSYNMTKCCLASGLLPQCTPLCSYNIRLSDIERLGPPCRVQLSVVARCAAGGRDHTPCCTRRGVAATCLPLCRGVLPAAPTANSSPDCLSYAGNILQCFEEGTENIPGPAEDVHVTTVTNNSISLAWLQPEFEGANNSNITETATAATESTESEAASTAEAVTASVAAAAASASTDVVAGIDFVVQFGKVNNMTMYETVAKLEHELTTNETNIDLTNLEPNTLYRITVATRGIYGTSLPSSMLLINTSSSANGNANTNATEQQADIYGAPSPPHSVTITAHSATWLQLTWQPPEFSHPHEKISYRVYHKAMKSDKFNKIPTKVSWIRMNNLKPSSQHIVYVEAVGEHATSLPSETLVAWTDPALPAFVDPPTVHPADNIPEGGSMTILCLALGNPAPTISLYVGGHLVRQDASRHMVTVIHNVTADMEHISCYADNGYGVPMQATRRVNICYPPKIQASGITVAFVGEEVELRCTVDSKPEPKTIFWRDHDGRVPVIQGGSFDIATRANDTHPSLYTMTLRINKLQAADVGDYFCHAENPFGSATNAVSVRIRSTPALNRNVSACCEQQNVTLACRTACSYYIDIDAIADEPECIPDLDKLMRCAADGSDHRSCCAEANVPRKCLNWCRGETVRSKEVCSLQYARTIVSCFETNRDRLPGPPENIAVNVVSDDEVQISWDPPSKNPNVVDGYRIFYHEAATVGEAGTDVRDAEGEANNTTAQQQNNSNNNSTNSTEVRRLDVKETNVKIEGLKKDVLYELVVKAGNAYGASVLTDPVKFTLGDHHVTSATTYSNTIGTVSGIIASLLAVLLAAAAVIFYRRHRAYHKSANGVAFENPTYTRGLEQVQLPTVTSAITHNNNSSSISAAPLSQQHTGSRSGRNGVGVGVGGGGGGGGGGDAYTTSTSNEVNPSIYEELKLGQEGAGFKKLVP